MFKPQFMLIAARTACRLKKNVHSTNGYFKFSSAFEKNVIFCLIIIQY